MNERIKELEARCWEPRQYGPAWFNSTKFAELIVRECLDKVAEAAHARRDPFFAYSQIQEHFGVEQ